MNQHLIIKSVVVDKNHYYTEVELNNLKEYVLSRTTYNIKQEKLLLASQKLKRLRKR
jgi:hypothetical protein